MVSDLGRVVVSGIALAIASVPAQGVEGALGRTLPGVRIQPQGAVVGPKPGINFTTIPIGYTGTIGGARLVPIGGSIFSNVDANISTNYLVPQYVYKTETKKVNLSPSFMGVVNWVGSSGTLQFNDISRSTSSSNGGIGDVVIVPLTVGIPFSDTNNLAVSTRIFAPTGQFRPANLSNLGVGEWTFMPNFAHTCLWEKRGLEFDNFVGFDIYTQNDMTRYTSGTMFHWDGMGIQYLSKTVGFGAIGSNLTQIRRPGVGSWSKGALGRQGREAGGHSSTPLGQRIRGDESFKGQHVSVRAHSEVQLTGLGRQSTKAVACRSQIVSSARLTSVMASSWEYAPLLVSGPRPREGVNLGVRATLSDIGQTVAANFSVAIAHGGSLLPQIV